MPRRLQVTYARHARVDERFLFKQFPKIKFLKLQGMNSQNRGRIGETKTTKNSRKMRACGSNRRKRSQKLLFPRLKIKNTCKLKMSQVLDVVLVILPFLSRPHSIVNPDIKAQIVETDFQVFLLMLALRRRTVIFLGGRGGGLIPA